MVDKKSAHSGNEEASDDDVDYDDEDDHAPAFYDKSKSFFDNISCDSTEKAHGYCCAVPYCGCSVKGWITSTVIEQLFRTIMNTSLLACYCVRNLWMRFAEGVGLIDET